MVKFKDDETLGKTVTKTQIFCSIGVEPVDRMFQLRFAAGGNKFSQLCGFIFDSANTKIEYKKFAIAFVCKLRSKIYRQQNTNPSQWFIFKRINKDRVDVLDKKALKINYGFDIDKFFDSDLFKAAQTQFEKYLNKGLESAEKFIEKQKNIAERDEAIRYTKAISEAIPIMLSSKKVNDKYFQLNDLDAIDTTVAKVDKNIKKKALDAKLAAMKKGNEQFMKRVAQNNSGLELNKTNLEDSEKLTETSFDQLEWKNGSVTGNGISSFVKNTKLSSEPVRIYDRKTAAYYNIVDSHITKKDGGISFEIDTRKPVVEKDDKKLEEKEMKIDESNLKPMTVKDILDDVNQWIKDDNEWSKAKFVVNAPDGKTYCVEYSGVTEDIPGGAYFVECGKEIKLKKPTKEADNIEKKEEPMKEDEEAKLKEKELDNDIEEALKEIYN